MIAIRPIHPDCQFLLLPLESCSYDLYFLSAEQGYDEAMDKLGVISSTTSEHTLSITSLSVKYGYIEGKFLCTPYLTDAEKETFQHSGVLYDADGNEIPGEEGNYTKFWATSDGQFKVTFPSGLSVGDYIYELIIILGDETISDRVYFSYVY